MAITSPQPSSLGDRSSLPLASTPILTPRRRSLLLVALLLGAVLTLIAGAVGFYVARSAALASKPFSGTVFSPPIDLPNLTLQRAGAGPFVTDATRGRVSLVFFGYTYCPDVCPLTLSHIAEVRTLMGPRADEVDAYFVTVDPERDTPERLATYVKHFGPGITGLTGTPEQLERSRAFLGVVAQQRENPDNPDAYFVDHTAAVFVVDQSSRVRLAFPYGLSPRQMADDLLRLLDSPVTSQSAARVPAAPTVPLASTPGRAVAVDGAWSRAARADGTPHSTSAVYFQLQNAADEPDTLLGASSDAAATVEIHRSFIEDGVMRMRPAGAVVIPAHGKVSLEPGGLHVMLIGLREDLQEGATITVTLRLERAGEITFPATVRAFQRPSH